MLARAFFVALLVFGSLASCLTPPALLPAGYVDEELAIELYPEGTERIEIPVANGARLRGLFVPSYVGAPVVLHLLESSGSVASLRLHYEILTAQLSDLGFASLLVDYTGIGASGGERSPRYLARDAQAMWSEAVARAGGDPGRVVVRGISLGTLAAGHLLAEGAEPAAVHLIVPVRAETAARRIADQRWGFLAAAIVGAAYRDLTDVDLVDTLAGCTAPLLVIAGEKDFFLSDEERAQFATAVETAGGRWIARPFGHSRGTIEGHALLSEEFAPLMNLFARPPDDEARVNALLAQMPPEVAARFGDDEALARLREMVRFARRGDPVLTAAVALANEPGIAAVRYRWMLEERGEFQDLSFDELVQVATLDGSSGPLPIEAIAAASLIGDLHDRFGGGGMSEHVKLVSQRIQSALAGTESALSYRVDLAWESVEIRSDAVDTIAQIRAAGFPEEDVARGGARILLKANRIPERVRRDADGRLRLEVWEKGAWGEFDFEVPIGGMPNMVFHLPKELGRRARELREEQEADEAGEQPSP